VFDAALLWTINAVTVTMVMCAVGWLDALVFHVLSARLCGVLPWMAPRTADAGQVTAGGGSPAGGTHQLSGQPGPGAMCRAKGVAADVGNDANYDHVHVH
jgi:hypothetical protein